MAAKEPSIQRLGTNGRRSSCVVHGGVLYTRGVTTVNLEGDITAQTQDVLAQLDKLMAACGTHKHNVLHATVYLRNESDYGPFNAVWDEWVDDGFEPVRSVIRAGLSLPEYRVKIELTAAVN